MYVIYDRNSMYVVTIFSKSKSDVQGIFISSPLVPADYALFVAGVSSWLRWYVRYPYPIQSNEHGYFTSNADASVILLNGYCFVSHIAMEHGDMSTMYMF